MYVYSTTYKVYMSYEDSSLIKIACIGEVFDHNLEGIHSIILLFLDDIMEYEVILLRLR